MGKYKENYGYPINIIFYNRFNATFKDSWKNLRTEQCSSKAMNGNISWIYSTEINFLTWGDTIICKLLKVYFFSKDGCEI